MRLRQDKVGAEVQLKRETISLLDDHPPTTVNMSLKDAPVKTEVVNLLDDLEDEHAKVVVDLLNASSDHSSEGELRNTSTHADKNQSERYVVNLLDDAGPVTETRTK